MQPVSRLLPGLPTQSAASGSSQQGAVTNAGARPAVASSGIPLPQPGPLAGGRMSGSAYLALVTPTPYSPLVRTFASVSAPKTSRPQRSAHTSAPAPATTSGTGPAPGGGATGCPGPLAGGGMLGSAYLALVTPTPYSPLVRTFASVSAPKISRPQGSAHTSAPAPAPATTFGTGPAPGGGATGRPGHPGGAGSRGRPFAAPGTGTGAMFAPPRTVVRARTGGVGGSSSAAAGGHTPPATSSSALQNNPEFVRLLGIFKSYQSNEGDNADTRVQKAKIRANDPNYKAARAALAVLLNMPANSPTIHVLRHLRRLGINTEGVRQQQSSGFAFGQVTQAKIEHWLNSRQIVCQSAGRLELSINSATWVSMLGQLSEPQLNALICNTLYAVPGMYGPSVITPARVVYIEKIVALMVEREGVQWVGQFMDDYRVFDPGTMLGDAARAALDRHRRGQP